MLDSSGPLGKDKFPPAATPHLRATQQRKLFPRVYGEDFAVHCARFATTHVRGALNLLEAAAERALAQIEMIEATTFSNDVVKCSHGDRFDCVSLRKQLEITKEICRKHTFHHYSHHGAPIPMLLKEAGKKRFMDWIDVGQRIESLAKVWLCINGAIASLNRQLHRDFSPLLAISANRSPITIDGASEHLGIEPRQPAQQHAAGEDEEDKPNDAQHLALRLKQTDASSNLARDVSRGLSLTARKASGGDHVE